MNRKLLLIVIVVPAVLVLLGSALVAGAQQNPALSSASGASSASMPRSTTIAGNKPPGSKGSLAGPGTAPLSAVGNAFTYQGQIIDGGNPATGQYDLQFTLYDAATAGTQVGSPITMINQTVTDGLFTVQLDFGPSAFQGSSRFLEIAVQPTGGTGYTTLSPRQPLTAAPYALSLAPGAVITGTNGTAMLTANNGNGNGIYGITGSAGSTAGLFGKSLSTNGNGIIGEAENGTYAYGVWGMSTDGYGVYGTSANSGVVGTGYFGVDGTGTSVGVNGTSTSVNSGAGVYGTGIYAGVSGTGTGLSGKGVIGEGTGSAGIGVLGSGMRYGAYDQGSRTGADSWGVFGTANGGVYGRGNTMAGVYGMSDSSYGVQGVSDTAYAAVLGQSTGRIANGTGVFGSGATGVYGTGSSYAGWFQGNVRITGACCAAAMGTYQIDDPLDPANKYLNHAAVQSPEIKDIYDGNVTTDAGGDATVVLPAYFQTLNRDFRYQLTVVGQFSNAIVSSKIKDNRFTIKTDKPNVEVSWQVTGVRQDPYAAAHPLTVEELKPANERGLYLHPGLYGQPPSKNIDPQVRNPPPSPPPSPPVMSPPAAAHPGGK